VRKRSESAPGLRAGVPREKRRRPSGFDRKPDINQPFGGCQFPKMALAKDGDWTKMTAEQSDDRKNADEVAQRSLVHDQERRRRCHPLFARLARRDRFNRGRRGCRFFKLDLVALDGHRFGVPDVLVVFEDGAIR